MQSESQQRARLVATLWNLKQAVKTHPLPGIPYIHFNTLLRQPPYRHEIIEAALHSGNEKLQSLAREARELNVEDAALLNPDDKRWLEQRDQQLAKAYATELEQAGRMKRRYALAAFVSMAMLALIVAGYFGYQRLTGVQIVKGALAGEQRWFGGGEYELDGLVTVASGARLVIEPGVTVRGRPGSALVVTRGGFLHAKGTATQPIVMTSAQPVGKRQPGDWGGLVLLGAAPINAGAAVIEGFPSGDPRGAYGGDEPRHPCGVLEYVRIEFAGFEALADNELNGLTLGGCGSDTVIRNIQVHHALDDGVEVFGGTVNLSRILVSQAADDALDWDQGWTGNVQFLITQQTETGDNAIEADNSSDHPDATPRSRPTLYNASLIGAPIGAQRAMTLRNGTSGVFGNLVASNFAVEFTDVRGPETVQAIETGDMRFDSIFLHRIGPRGAGAFADESGDKDDDGGFNEAGYFLAPGRAAALRDSMRLPIRSQNASDPDFVPSGHSELAPAAIPVGEFWDESATFPGAVRPGENSPWYAGWTAFPKD